ncbi:MAG: hypothetical protein K0Q53_127 [Massilibacillus sp.]|jgi:hypothetical protein|nr:hypothetical protein [Massilibacillus sp.]
MKNKLILCKSCGNCKYQNICTEGKVSNGQTYNKFEYCDKFAVKRGEIGKFDY